MTPEIDYERLTPVAYPLADLFYKQAREKGKTQRQDEVYVARIAQQIVAAVKLCPIRKAPELAAPLSGALLLRSLAVLPDRRRTGVGHHFMGYVAEQIGARQCWCYPFSWLTAFYEQSGFQQVEIGTVPGFIRLPYETYRRQGRDITIMVRPAK